MTLGVRSLSAALMAGAVVIAAAGRAPLSAQSTASPQGQPAGVEAAREAALRDLLATASTNEPPATLIFSNRPIVEFRATLLARPPAVRAAGARNLLEQLAGNPTPGAVTSRPVADGFLISIGGADVFGLVPGDLDPAATETLPDFTQSVVGRLQLALDEAVELRSPGRLVRASVMALIATAIFFVLIRLLVRGQQTLAALSTSAADRQLQKIPGAEIMRASRLLDVLRYLVTLVSVGVGGVMAYAWLTFVLRRFPYTRPWGEALRGFLIAELIALGNAVLTAIPNLFTVLVIVILTRIAIKLATLLFASVEDGRTAVPWVYPETAVPTRRLVTVFLWLFALALAFPYLPGSDTDAFKGVSVFVGLVISLGSSGIVNQMMSGLTITYSRALRQGDFVRIGDLEGTVTHLGNLSLKLKTPTREEITIPNTVVVGTQTTNFSRFADSEGVFASTSVTIGYDTPWRQVKALLLLGAARTAGVRQDPAPAVRQTALEDFYVRYTLLVSLEDPALRAPILDQLHGHILDAFNEHGVQIMSPNYEADPAGPKVVPPDRWHAAPALGAGEAKPATGAVVTT